MTDIRISPVIRAAWWVHIYLLACVALSWVGVRINEQKMYRRAARGIYIPK